MQNGQMDTFQLESNWPTKLYMHPNEGHQMLEASQPNYISFFLQRLTKS